MILSFLSDLEKQMSVTEIEKASLLAMRRKLVDPPEASGPNKQHMSFNEIKTALRDRVTAMRQPAGTSAHSPCRGECLNSRWHK